MDRVAGRADSIRQHKSRSIPRRTQGVDAARHDASSSMLASRAMGNQVVGSLLRAAAEGYLQTKLTVNTPGDAYEQEADHVAEQVMRTPAEPSQGMVQRKCAECSQEHDEEMPAISRMATPGAQGGAVAPAVQAGIGAIAGSGAPLPQSERAFFGKRMGADFADVRIHTGDTADTLAHTLQARAFTVGNDVVFRSGEYNPGTDAGRRLLAHELTHVVQQGGGRSMVQRTLTLTDPGGPVPQPAGTVGPAPSRALSLQSWLNELCAAGAFTVDAATGAVTSANRATFCGATRTRGQAHHTTSGTPTGCDCLCQATDTAAGSKNIEVQIDENITFNSGAGTSVVSLTTQGGAATAQVSATDKVVASRGFGFGALQGAGDTSPIAAGTGNRDQTLRIPDWLAFGHELCGHAVASVGGANTGHTTTPTGDRSATDFENRLRREHSTVADSLGIRLGFFNAPDSAGTVARRFGASYRVSSGETLSSIATRVGIPVADMLDHIWRAGSVRITAATQNTLATGEELLIEGIEWHQVISGESLASIARIWNVSLASLQRANPQVTGPSFTIRPGDRLLIPVR